MEKRRKLHLDIPRTIGEALPRLERRWAVQRICKHQYTTPLFPTTSAPCTSTVGQLAAVPDLPSSSTPSQSALAPLVSSSRLTMHATARYCRIEIIPVPSQPFLRHLSAAIGVSAILSRVPSFPLTSVSTDLHVSCPYIGSFN